MKFTTKEVFFKQMNTWFQEKKPYFFLIDYKNKQHLILPLKSLHAHKIFIASPLFTNVPVTPITQKELEWKKYPITKKKYALQFEKVKKALQHGDAYLVNLTCSTPINTNYSLQELFTLGSARYKLYFQEWFTHFSPEPFVQIKQNIISSFPMKGTIDAALKDAKMQLLNNTKELHEQYTIVDLIRNDLSRVAQKVRVTNFRYVESIKTNQKELLAMSSKICGEIRPIYQNCPGTLFQKLLPAGSITGAPKEKTIETIENSETHQRNFYTGIWGVFDGEMIDSCVIIRYLEKENNQLIFKSGGGITYKSKMEEEYQEMIDKVYVPIYK